MNFQVDDYNDVAYEINKGLSGKIIYAITSSTNGVIGLCVVLAVIGLSFVTVMDLVYVSLPIANQLIRKKGWDGSKKEKGLPISLVSKDAIKAVERAEELNAMGSGTTVIVQYLKLRTLTYIKVSIIIFILMYGVAPVVKVLKPVVYPVMDMLGLS